MFLFANRGLSSLLKTSVSAQSLGTTLRTIHTLNNINIPSLKPVVPKKPKRSVPVSSSVDRDQSHREGSRVSAAAPLSREGSDIRPTPTVRKTDIRTETQPNGSEVTTTIVEFTDQVNFIFHC